MRERSCDGTLCSEDGLEHTRKGTKFHERIGVFGPTHHYVDHDHVDGGDDDDDDDLGRTGQSTPNTGTRMSSIRDPLLGVI